MCDLGGNTDIVLEQLKLDREAREAGICIVPDCGQVPGMGTTLMVYAMGLLDKAEEVFMWDGGLPQQPRPPFDYLLTFNIAGLTNEYAESPIFLRDGKPTRVEAMSELEEIEFPTPVGLLEDRPNEFRLRHLHTEHADPLVQKSANQPILFPRRAPRRGHKLNLHPRAEFPEKTQFVTVGEESRQYIPPPSVVSPPVMVNPSMLVVLSTPSQ